MSTDTLLLQPVLDTLRVRLIGIGYTLPARVQTDSEAAERLELDVRDATIIAYTDDTDIVVYATGRRGLQWEMRFTHAPAELVAAALAVAITDGIR